jgi:hypothetical protein
VFALKPVRFALTADALVPDPTDCAVVAVKVDNVLDVPHSNHAVVAAPFGLTVPFIVAELVVTDPAAVVTTAGARGIVAKLQTADQPLVPPVFLAFTRQ